jgi:hypothetical protein
MKNTFLPPYQSKSWVLRHHSENWSSKEQEADIRTGVPRYGYERFGTILTRKARSDIHRHRNEPGDGFRPPTPASREHSDACPVCIQPRMLPTDRGLGFTVIVSDEASTG